MPKYVKVQGTWKAVDESADCGKVKVNGVWRTVSNSYVKVADVWRSVCAPAPVSTTTTTTAVTTVPVTTATTAQAYPNIGSVIAYGAGAGQAWTSNAAYITWGGSGWGSYTVTASNGSSNNSPSAAGGPPVLLTGFSANTNYSVTVTLFANANYSGSSASASTSFTTGATATTTTTTTTTTTPAGNYGTIYLAYCYQNAPVVEQYPVDANNILVQDISQACSVYTNLLSGIGATSIDCSTSSPRTAPTGCVTTTTTTTSPYPALLSGFHLCTAQDAPNPASPCPSNGSGTGVNCVENGASGASCSVVTTTTTAAQVTYYTGTSACQGTSGNYASSPSVSGPFTAASIPADSENFSGNILTVYRYRSTSSAALAAAVQDACNFGATTTTTASTTVTTTTTNCQTCNAYNPSDGSYTLTRPDTGCASGSRYYRTCVTPGGCPNIDQDGSCVPVATTTTTSAVVNCQTCNTYSPNSDGSYATRANAGCPDTGLEYYRTCVTPGACPNIDQTNGCVPGATTTTTTTAATSTYCPSLGYNVPLSGYPGNCPGAGGGGTTTTTTSAAATGKICSRSDYINQCCSCFSEGACDVNGSLSACTL